MNQSQKTEIKGKLCLAALVFFAFFVSNLAFSQTQVASFFATPVTQGLIEVRLYPMENVNAGTPTLVTFGVPFTRGSMPMADTSKIRVLSVSSQLVTEIPSHIKALTPWRHISNTAIDNKFLRIARIQITKTFSVAYPNYETIFVEYGTTERAAFVNTFVNPKNAWHYVTSGSFVQTDSIQEPDTYAVLPKEYLTQGAIRPSQMLPLDPSVPLTRENPSTVAATNYTGFKKHDHAVHNFFFTLINEDDPLVSVANQIPYKTSYEPWLYDRASAMYNLYFRSGNIKALKEAVRNAQFYKKKLYPGTTLPTRYIGTFKLKVPTTTEYIGNNGAMYSYNECLAYTYWLTGDPDMVEPINWVVNAHKNNPATRWFAAAYNWTERFPAYHLLAHTVAYEVTGNQVNKDSMIAHNNHFIWHQNGAGGRLPANRIDGGLYHYGRQHGDGTADSLVASPWMTGVLVNAMIRSYAFMETNEMANFFKRVGTFYKASIKSDPTHIYNTSASLYASDYMTLYNGASNERGWEEVEHAIDMASSLAWTAYFSALVNKYDPTLYNYAKDLYHTYTYGVSHWIRPTAPLSPNFKSAYRVSPFRKYNWENIPSANFTWLMGTLAQHTCPSSVYMTLDNKLRGGTYQAKSLIMIEGNVTTLKTSNVTFNTPEFKVFAPNTFTIENGSKVIVNNNGCP
jgi:hypothetical protein